MEEQEARRAIAQLMAQQPEAFQLALNLAKKGDIEAAAEELAEWTAAFINDLPDSAFAYIEPGGEKDGDGKTIPRSKRHFPHHGSGGGVDMPHLRNALSRALQSPFGKSALAHLRRHASAEGVGEKEAMEPMIWGSSVELAIGKPVVLIREGKWEHPEYGEFEVTQADIDRMVQNFEAKVTKQDTPIDVDHDHSRGAVGWLQRVFKSFDDGGRAILKGIVDWTEDGTRLVGQAFRHTSIHYDPDYQDAETGTAFGPTIRSASITNFPFVKDMEPISLSEFQRKLKEVEVSEEKEEAIVLTEEERGFIGKLMSFFKGDAKPEEKPEQPPRELTELKGENLKLREQVEAQEKALAEIKVERRRERFMAMIEGGRWVGDRAETIGLMESLADKFGEESDQFKAYAKQQVAHAEQLWQSGLFGERGTTAPAASEAEKVKAEVVEIREQLKLADNPDGNSRALREYYRRHPDEYVKAQRGDKA